MNNFIILIGLLTGFLSGLLGIGGGTVLVPGLVILAGLSQHMSQGIALAVIVPTAALGAYGYFRKGNVLTSLLVFMAIGAVLGAVAGSNLANLIPAFYLRKMFGFFVIFIAIKIFTGK
ncbi:MAG: sulfite exporter TauE/SafE family protein [Candidatus Margulisbacteria bacterium]|nr:sulfite exporter TauE/SafE family protein [Candidatus Margulisiibacteriota bacterium]MBU1022585.1 sulfite exporter TauE/SafE family protein [Candidatus Margulisiibacteriota bacterium]MBU1728871.1 sulfite exporter TauE/SafE family protein [Candidatus Margulisiibacteriota bacterium]MBU1955502.1 sulfite exporter TauE/SafE family protein [Candidatus Margulisiibacteriota bacterium]